MCGFVVCRRVTIASRSFNSTAQSLAATTVVAFSTVPTATTARPAFRFVITAAVPIGAARGASAVLIRVTTAVMTMSIAPTATTPLSFGIRASSYVCRLAASVATAESAMSVVPTSSTVTSRRRGLVVGFTIVGACIVISIFVGLAVGLQKARFSGAFSSVIVGVDTSVAVSVKQARFSIAFSSVVVAVDTSVTVSVQKARFSSAFSSVVVGVGVCVDAGVGVSIGIGIDV